MGGLNKIPAFDGLATAVGSKFAALGLPLPPHVAAAALAIAVFLEVAGGVALSLGMERIGATLIALFLLAITPVMHSNVSDQNEMIAVLKASRPDRV